MFPNKCDENMKKFFRDELNIIQVLKLAVMAAGGIFGAWALFRIISLLEQSLSKIG
jgi:hypothetical protein